VDSGFTHRAVSRFALGDIDGMEADFKKAIRLNPDDPEIYQNRAVLLREMAKRENAFMAKMLIERAEKDEMIRESKLH